MEQFGAFVKEHWRLIYTAYKGHPNSCYHILNDFHLGRGSFTCFFTPYLWVDLFCDRVQPVKQKKAQFRPGHLYLCEASAHHFTIVYPVPEDGKATVIYADYYEEARGVDDAFRVSIMDENAMHEALAILQGDSAEAIAAFHDAESVEDLDIHDIHGGLYIESIFEYPIVRTPTLDTLLEVCRTAGPFYSKGHNMPGGDLEDGSYFPERSRINEYDRKWQTVIRQLAGLCAKTQ